jgi:hypothetical protein
MSELIFVRDNIYEGSLDMGYGLIGKMWKDFGADIIIGFPTYKTHMTTPRLLRDSVIGAMENFPHSKVALIVTDGTYNHNDRDKTTIEAVLSSAVRVFEEYSSKIKDRIMVIATPYDGYQGNRTPGKGSALRLIYEEMSFCNASFLILADGDLRNNMKDWQKVYKSVIAHHNHYHREKEFFITAGYARHFLDASITRFIVGPLTTLMGKYVPGGISGDIVLSRGAVEHERNFPWTERRRKYGTDISTTFDNIADKNTLIYEVYLGAKLHDITDEAKLNVMPGEVIGAALERILYYEKNYGFISEILNGNESLQHVEVCGTDKSGIDFIDPGFTGIFNIDLKISTLVDRFPAFREDIKKIIDSKTYENLEYNYGELKRLSRAGEEDLFFLNVDRETWKNMLFQSIAYVLVTQDIETVTGGLNYLYTAAFLEFCREKLNELGYFTLQEIRDVQSGLGVPPERAKQFYRENVDMIISQMAKSFFDDRYKIKNYTDKLRKSKA